MPLPLTRLAQNPGFVLRGDADVPIYARQWFEFPRRNDGNPETWCYTDRLTYSAGERIVLFAISTEPRADIEVRSETLHPRVMLRMESVSLTWADTAETASVTGCNWPAIAELEIGADWPSGAYRITVRPRGSDDTAGTAMHLIVVRPTRKSQTARLLLITADSTWNAYNDWGGSNHYEGVIEPESNRFSPRLSNQRPFARGLVSLPSDAPRTLPDAPPPFGAKVSYPHMEWAWREGYSKKYASAGWAAYEKHFANWAESQGYSLAITTQQDLHFRPDVLEDFACVVMIGHDEYWSWKMRDAIDAYVARGGHVARFAGNFLWQIRLERDGCAQVCYKYLAREEDPCFDSTDRHLTTTCWEAAEVGRPGHTTFGLDGSRGVYAGWGGLAPRGSGGFTLYRPEHWAFARCGLGYGDLLGAGGRVFGYEVDGLDYRIEQGLPYAEEKPTLPDDLKILALGLARLREDRTEDADQPLFVGDYDARFIAELRYGTGDADALQRVNRGTGMIVCFSKGTGEVFHAGSTEWVAGLLRRDKAIEQVTRNVLDRYLGN